jgi:hypothetical protein
VVTQDSQGGSNEIAAGTDSPRNPRLGRRALVTAAALAPLVASTRGAFGAADPAVNGRWSAPFDMGGVAIHAMLLHTDDVLIFQYVEGAAGVDHTSWVGTWNWRTGVTREAPFTYNRDIFCASHNVLADGRVFIAGGHDHTTGKKGDGVGVADTDVYDPTTRTWSPTPPLGQKRWYPTNVGLANGRTLVFGGQEETGSQSNTIDEYNAVTSTTRSLPASATKPMGMYPRLHLLPNGKVLRSGPQRQSLLFNPTTSSWATLPPMLFGARLRGSVVLLPGATRVLNMGGAASGTAAPTATAEILDTSVAAPQWRSTTPMTHPRLLMNSVVLPSGEVLVLGGGAAFEYTSPVFVPELYDPVSRSWKDMAPQQASRMYHSTALLLPDGRVLSAGQDFGPLARFGEIFSPPYLFRGPRPTVVGAPASIVHGRRFSFTSNQAADVRKVVLVRPGSATHQVDTDQRSVPLQFSVSGSSVSALVPANVNQVPPAYYLLFALNSLGVPSVAPWVRVGAPA